MEECWGSSSSGSSYESEVPIKNILNLFNNSCCGVSYGDKSACFHDISATDNNILKANNSLVDWGYKSCVAYKSKRGQFSIKVLDSEEVSKFKLVNLENIKNEKLKELENIQSQIFAIEKTLNKDDAKISL